MGKLRILPSKDCRMLTACLALLLLWTGGGPAGPARPWLMNSPNEVQTGMSADADQSHDEQQRDRAALSNLEAVVAPVARLPLAFTGSFVFNQPMHKPVAAPHRVPLLLQNSYLRTLFRLITPANAP